MSTIFDFSFAMDTSNPVQVADRITLREFADQIGLRKQDYALLNATLQRGQRSTLYQPMAPNEEVDPDAVKRLLARIPIKAHDINLDGCKNLSQGGSLKKTKYHPNGLNESGLFVCTQLKFPNFSRTEEVVRALLGVGYSEQELSEYVYSAGTPAGLEKRLKKMWSRKKISVSKLTEFNVMPNKDLLAILPVDASKLPDLSSEVFDLIGDIKVNMKSDAGLPFSRKKTEAYSEIVEFLSEFCLAVKDGNGNQFIAENKESIASLCCNKTDKYKMKDVVEESKTRPYYKFNAAYSFLISVLCQPFCESLKLAVEKDESCNFYGFSWANGGGDKLHRWIMSTQENKMKFGVYGDDAILVTKKGGKIYVVCPDFTAMDGSVDQDLVKLVVKYVLKAHYAKLDKVCTDEISRNEAKNFWDYIGQLWVYLASSSPFLVAGTSTFNCKGGLRTGVVGTTLFDTAKSALAYQALREQRIDITKPKKCIEFLRNLGLEVKEGTWVVEEYKNGEEFPMQQKFLGGNLKKVKGLSRDEYIFHYPEESQVKSLSASRQIHFDSETIRKRMLFDQMRGAMVSGAFHHEKLWAACVRVIEGLPDNIIFQRVQAGNRKGERPELYKVVGEDFEWPNSHSIPSIGWCTDLYLSEGNKYGYPMDEIRTNHKELEKILSPETYVAPALHADVAVVGEEWNAEDRNEIADQFNEEWFGKEENLLDHEISPSAPPARFSADVPPVVNPPMSSREIMVNILKLSSVKDYALDYLCQSRKISEGVLKEEGYVKEGKVWTKVESFNYKPPPYVSQKAPKDVKEDGVIVVSRVLNRLVVINKELEEDPLKTLNYMIQTQGFKIREEYKQVGNPPEFTCKFYIAKDGKEEFVGQSMGPSKRQCKIKFWTTALGSRPKTPTQVPVSMQPEHLMIDPEFFSTLGSCPTGTFGDSYSYIAARCSANHWHLKKQVKEVSKNPTKVEVKFYASQVGSNPSHRHLTGEVTYTNKHTCTHYWADEVMKVMNWHKVDVSVSTPSPITSGVETTSPASAGDEDIEADSEVEDLAMSEVHFKPVDPAPITPRPSAPTPIAAPNASKALFSEDHLSKFRGLSLVSLEDESEDEYRSVINSPLIVDSLGESNEKLLEENQRIKEENAKLKVLIAAEEEAFQVYQKNPALGQKKFLALPKPICTKCNGLHHVTACPGTKCPLCKKNGHASDMCPERTCKACNKKGHSAVSCPEKRPQITQINHRKDFSDRFCLTCFKQTGQQVFTHLSRRCPFALCYKCKEQGHIAQDCPSGPGKKCSNCSQDGHVTRQCPSVKCRSCNQNGHIEKYCKNRPDPPKDRSKQKANNNFCLTCKKLLGQERNDHLSANCPNVQCYKCKGFGHISGRCELVSNVSLPSLPTTSYAETTKNGSRNKGYLPKWKRDKEQKKSQSKSTQKK